MDNQHKKIKGYRDLSQVEIDLMNKVKEKGVEIGKLVAEIQIYLNEQATAKRNATVVGYTDIAAAGTSVAQAPVYAEPESEEAQELARFIAAEPQRWAAIAKTDFQTALMALTRSIAQPGFF